MPIAFSYTIERCLRILLVSFIAGITPISWPKAKVYLADRLVFITDGLSDRIPARAVKWKVLPLFTPNDKLRIKVQVNNAIFRNIGVFVCDETNLKLLSSRQPYRCFGTSRAFANFEFDARPYSQSAHYLVFDNRGASFLARKIRYVLTIETPLPYQTRKGLINVFEKAFSKLKKAYIYPEFDFIIEPCGQKNAFSDRSSGNITFCSELFILTFIEQAKGAFTGILAHELAHTLLNLWGEPNSSNERTADELAVVLLILQEQEELVWQWINWFVAKQDLIAEAQAAVYGDLHPLTVQRVNAIREIMRNPGQVIQRWNRVLYRHMTDEALQRTISDRPPYGDAKLARQILGSR